VLIVLLGVPRRSMEATAAGGAPSRRRTSETDTRAVPVPVHATGPSDLPRAPQPEPVQEEAEAEAEEQDGDGDELAFEDTEEPDLSAPAGFECTVPTHVPFPSLRDTG
jgi:hypothetical protein